MNLIRFFYVNIVGYYPEDSDLINKTACMIDYLIDCGYTEKEIVDIMSTCKSDKTQVLTLPDSLWKDSLLERDAYYLHRELRIVSPAPYIDKEGNEVSFPLSIEMKIRYTLEDVLNYFYFRTGLMIALQDRKKHIAQLGSILRKLNKFEGAEPIDMLLTIIDMAADDYTLTVLEPFDIDKSKLHAEAYDLLKRNLAQNKLEKGGKIIWRQDVRNISTNSAEI